MLQRCGYGCGRKAKFSPRKGMTKWCCESHYNKCPSQIKLKIERAKKSGKLNRTPWNKGKKGVQTAWNKGKKWPKQSKDKMSKSSKLSINKIKRRYPFFSQIEEMRYNPDKPKEIQVRCKNHLCPNSKEQGGWFSPTYSQLYERIRHLEKEYGNDGNYFYCSDSCKKICPLYHLKKESFNSEIVYTHQELQIWRQKVLNRENYLCEYCGEKATIAHHEKPVKTHPHLALDPDNGIACCEKCHYKYAHKTGTECSTGSLANKICM